METALTASSGTVVNFLNDINTGLSSCGAKNIKISDESTANQMVHRPMTVLCRRATRILHVRGLDQAMLDQKFQDKIVVGGHSFILPANITLEVVHAIIAAKYMQVSTLTFFQMFTL